MKKILVIGGGGFVRSEIVRKLKKCKVITADRKAGGNNHIQTNITNIMRTPRN